jgi:hypothetical protein
MQKNIGHKIRVGLYSVTQRHVAIIAVSHEIGLGRHYARNSSKCRIPGANPQKFFPK